MNARSLRLATVVGATLGLLGGSLLTGSGAGAGAGAGLPHATSFTDTHGAQRYIVAAAVCAVEIVAAGAQGGMAAFDFDGTAPPLGVPGGLGGEARATITVRPGEVLEVNAGGAGGDATEQGPGAGGWNGGGSGGGIAGGGGGGGGGASDVRQGGDGLGDRVVVGGGGGGAANFVGPADAADGYGVPGVGGNPATPGTGELDVFADYSPAQGGGAGTGTAGGSGGAGAQLDTGDGFEIEGSGGDGGLGIGGHGATSVRAADDPDSADYGGGGGGAGNAVGEHFGEEAVVDLAQEGALAPDLGAGFDGGAVGGGIGFNYR